ncbi:MAG: single-stranded DNA-binding protein [Reichenbachiella sp.]|uniref:single-stranded DNA-binding protein n=1 Tax=Reichenbachiella sp. TaxID=2184521 RepID=UPI0029667DA6|nr:single-stranded DNA-binding protein [Reichenbachiella sp.]MDW3210296.1 single-stranded DNA-binding protein [Reichenbachiella sp.]
MSEQTKENQNELFADTNISMKSGRLVKDAELIANGKFVRMRLATNKQYESDDGVKTLVNYFNVLVSSNLTDAFAQAKDLKKGDWAYIKGEDNSKSVDTAEGYKETAVTTFAYKVTKKKAVQNNEPQPETVAQNEPAMP